MKGSPWLPLPTISRTAHSPSLPLSRLTTIMMMMEEKEGEKDDSGCWLQRSPSELEIQFPCLEERAA